MAGEHVEKVKIAENSTHQLTPHNENIEQHLTKALPIIGGSIALCETEHEERICSSPACEPATAIRDRSENIPPYGCGTGNTINDHDGIIDANRPACEPNVPIEKIPSCGTGETIKTEPQVPTECNSSKQHNLPPLMDEQEIEVEITAEPPQPELEDGNNINCPTFTLPTNEHSQSDQVDREENTSETETAVSFPSAEEVVIAEGKLCVSQPDKETLDVSKSKNVINEAFKKKSKINIKTFLSNISDPEVRKFLEGVIKKWHEQINKPHCKEHGKLLQKGKHIYLPIQLEDVIPDASDWEKLSKAFDETISVVTSDGERVPVWIDYQHLLTPVIKINCETGEADLAGFHHDYLEKIANSGALDFRIIERYEDGTYDAEWRYGNVSSKESSFFPSTWNQSEVIEKVIESLKNPVDQERQGHRLKITGITSEGIKIETILEFNIRISGSKSAKLITAYPIKPREVS